MLGYLSRLTSITCFPYGIPPHAVVVQTCGV